MGLERESMVHKQVAFTQHTSCPGDFLAKATLKKRMCLQNKSDSLKLYMFNKPTTENVANSFVLMGL